ncbi:PQQ-binding-like beta-propeller repeat protein [bacterium]|nr:PQQ-binding-like beta-propeller repeat protein [bacterium]
MNRLFKGFLLFLLCANVIFGLEPGELIWNAEDNASSYSPPAIGPDGTIYVGLNFGSWTKDGNLYAFDPDGSIQWAFDAAGEIERAPSVDSDGTIYFGTASGRTSIDDGVFALNPDGALKWSYITDTNVESPISIGYNGTLYFIFNSRLLALNSDGILQWEYLIGSCSYYAAAVIGSDSTIYLGNERGELHAINPDGTQKWIFDRGGEVGGPAAVGSDGTIYIGYQGRYSYSSEHCLYAVNPDGTEKWNFKPEEMEFLSSAPVIGPDSTIYISDNDVHLYAINSNGEEKWHVDKSSTGYGRAPAIGADGRIYTGCIINGYLYAFNPDGSEEWVAKLGDGDFTSCAIGKNGTIYAANEDYGFCAISSEAYGLANSEWPRYMGGNSGRGRPDDPAPPNDIGVVSIEMNSVVQINNDYNLKVMVHNYGSESQSNFQIGYQAGDSESVIEEYAGILRPNSMAEYTFQTVWTPDRIGNIELTVFTDLNADAYTSNDTLQKSLRIAYQKDVNVSMIQVPSKVGIDRSVTLKVGLFNNGTDQLSNFPVSYQIDTGTWITENYSGTLSPQEEDIFSFSETWTPDALGSYQISVKTELEGDQNSENDQRTKMVEVVNAAYMGTWEGSTSQNKSLSFTVNDQDEVISVSVELKVDMGSIYCTTTFSSSQKVPVVDDTFSVSLSMPTISANPDFIGRFTSIETCTGEIPKYTCAGGFCGDTFVFGTGVTNKAMTWSADRTSYVGIDEKRVESSGCPDHFTMNQNYPNPFNPSTEILYELAKAANIKLTVYDALGRQVTVLFQGKREPGIHRVIFDAGHLSSGVYIAVLNVDGKTMKRKMILMK